MDYADHENDHGHHEPGFIGKYVFSQDHKIIGIQFLFASLIFMILGGALAMGIRWHIAYAQQDLPIAGLLPDGMTDQAPADPAVWREGHPLYFSMDYENEELGLSVKEGDKARFLEVVEYEVESRYREKPKIVKVEIGGKEYNLDILDFFEGAPLVSDRMYSAFTDDFYSTMFTMHGSVMIFLVIIPLLVGAFGNFVVPLQIGARDMAFPFINMLSFWMFLAGALVMLFGTFFAYGSLPGGGQGVFFHGGSSGPGAGWTSYPPLAVVTDPRAFGQTCWLIAIIITGTSSILGAFNYVTTIVKMRAPGMGFFRMPLTVWAIFITSILTLFATPVLASAGLMQVMDQLGASSFFIARNTIVSDQAVANTGGGQPLLWQHLFWFYSHPAVYIMILPAMGIASDVLSTFSRKPIFGYRPMIYAIAAIAGLGFIVWGHHMFVSGMNPALGTTFTLSTIMIALPSAIKTFNWLGTLWGGNIRFTVPMMHAIAFVAMFVIGGLSGIFMASTPVDIFIHDTYFIVAHIHYVLFGGSMFAIFAGITYWFPKMFGKMMHPLMGKVHFWLTFIFFNMTFFPMHILGMGGMPRRYAGYGRFESLDHLISVNEFITVSALLLGTVQVIFAVNLFWSLAFGKKAVRNPWHSNTLEWVAPSPPGHGNFERIPVVRRGPYEYASPEVEEDYLPQDRMLGGPAPA